MTMIRVVTILVISGLLDLGELLFDFWKTASGPLDYFFDLVTIARWELSIRSIDLIISVIDFFLIIHSERVCAEY
jgi:hypothetical protein